MAADTTDLVPVETSLVLPTVDAQGMRDAMRRYTELCHAVLDPATDYQTIQGKRFKKRSAWQKLATAFAVSTEIIRDDIFTDDDGRVVRAQFIVRATAPNGRHEDGYGACSTREARGFNKPDHDIPATAETRARNRACANLFAFGELTAEEMAGGQEEVQDERSGLPPASPDLAVGRAKAAPAKTPGPPPAQPTRKNTLRINRTTAPEPAATATPIAAGSGASVRAGSVHIKETIEEAVKPQLASIKEHMREAEETRAGLEALALSFLLRKDQTGALKQSSEEDQMAVVRKWLDEFSIKSCDMPIALATPRNLQEMYKVLEKAVNGES